MHGAEGAGSSSIEEPQAQLDIAHARTAEAEALYNRNRKEARYGAADLVVRDRNWRTRAEIEYDTAIERERALREFIFGAQPSC
ncbi:MAG: hypothetical protein ACLPOA_09835 [Methylocella sp.]